MGFWDCFGKQNEFSSLNDFKARVSPLPFALYSMFEIVLKILRSTIYTNYLKTEKITTTKPMLN